MAMMPTMRAETMETSGDFAFGIGENLALT